jgi:predicted NACHT family NTPase
LKNRKQGLVLIGPPGTGKTTFMHFMVREQAKEVLEQPRTAQVPILVSATKWGERDAVDVLRTTMQSYYPVPDRTFTRLLKRGRLMCFFDSLDETPTSDAFLAKLKMFHLEYPNNPLILST